MTFGETLLLILGAIVAVGVLALLGFAVAVGLARRPDRAPVTPIDSTEMDDYFARRAAFAVTVTARTPLSRDEVFARLVGRRYLSSLPFLNGPDWRDEAVDSRGIWSERTMSGTVFSVSELVNQFHKDEMIGLTGTAVCLPATIGSFAEKFVLADTERPGVLEVRWTIAGTPRWIGFLPWRWAAPLSRPVFGFVLRHVLRLGAFRAPRVDDDSAA